MPIAQPLATANDAHDPPGAGHVPRRIVPAM